LIRHNDSCVVAIAAISQKNIYCRCTLEIEKVLPVLSKDVPERIDMDVERLALSNLSRVAPHVVFPWRRVRLETVAASMGSCRSNPEALSDVIEVWNVAEYAKRSGISKVIRFIRLVPV
jgi:hypothetical protein